MEDIIKKLCNIIMYISSFVVFLIIMIDAITFEERTKYGKNKMLFAFSILFFVSIFIGTYIFKNIVDFLF